MILDIGCGFVSTTRPLIKNNVVHVDIKKSDYNKVFLTVCCDGQCLPFRNNVFTLGYASHVLEHVYNPLKFLRELKRVVRKKVIIIVPRLRNDCLLREYKNHIYTWSLPSLRALLSLVFSDVEVYPCYRVRDIGMPFLRKTFNNVIFWVYRFLSDSGKSAEIMGVCSI